MKITLKKADKSEKEIIQNLACFYTYDMSRHCGFLPGWETPSDGNYTCFDLSRYWEEPDRYPYLIEVDKELAGFALLHKIGSTVDIDWTIGEFFIVAKFQGKGIGCKIAHQLFNRFNGKWEVMQIPENSAAIAFWKKVIHEYTEGNFEISEKTVQDPKPHPMIVMTFSSSPDSGT